MKKVLCFGTFDILHKGHREFLIDAKEKGDFLIVIVIHDDAVYENKKSFPKNNQKIRALNLKKLGMADKIIGTSNNKDNNIKLIKKLNPNTIVLGYDQKSKFISLLKNEFKKTKFIKSKEFAGGIHTSKLKWTLKN